MNNSRRDFIKKETTGAAFLAAPAILGSAGAADAVTPFKLKYAPGLGMFSRHAGQGPVYNIKFCHGILVAQMKEGVEVSKRTGAKQGLVICQTIRTPFP